MDRPVLDAVSSQAATGLVWKLITRTLAIALLGLCGAVAWTFPVGAPWLSAALLGYLLLLWRWPSAWLVVVPAALPVLDLGFWSGRFFFNAYDLVVLTTIAAGLWRGGAWRAQFDRGTAGLALLLLLAQSLVTLNGLLPLYTPVPGAWTDYFASTNALREFKGVLWALLLWPMLAASRARGEDLQRWLSIGMLAGLAGAIATIAWERILFTGLFNLTSPYRVSGWFSVMLTGGAAIDAFLALSAPFIAALLLLWRARWAQILGLLLGLGALYALYVTYSRANYPALAVMAVVFLGGLWLGRPIGHRRLPRPAFIAAALAGLMLVSLLALSGRNIQARFETTTQDLAVRFSHWSQVLDILNDTPDGFWLGAGKGSFPRDYYLHHELQGQHLALAQRHQEDDQSFIRFTPSDKAGNLFLQQRLSPVAKGGHKLVLRLRAPHGKAEALLVELCERHILKFRSECRWYKVRIPAGNGDWQTFSTAIDLSGLGLPRLGSLARPLDISLMNRGIHNGLDIGSAQIIGPGNRMLLQNPDFTDGWDHWFLSYGDHLRWHIKNVFIYWLYQGGALGLLVMLAACTYIGLRLARAAARGDRFAVLVASALAGCLMVGLFDSLFDEPRIALLFLLLAGAGLIGRPSAQTLAAAAQPISLLTAQQWRRLALLAGAGLALLLVVATVASRLSTGVQLRLLAWAEQRVPVLTPLFDSEDRNSAVADLRAAMPAWQAWAADGLGDNEIRIGERRFTSLKAASRALRNGDQLDIGPGIYREPLVIRANGVHVLGHGRVVIERTSAEGKAAIITKGNDIRISNIECRHISVSDQNGACIRHERQNLTLDHVYFHDAEQGLLSGAKPGKVHILRSRFEQLGKLGQAHAIYVGGGQLIIEDSQILSSRNWGHEIKSRALETTLIRSVVASLGGNDSRLLDLPHGGILEVRDSVLEQGPASSNEGAIGFGLEGRRHPEQRLTLSGNIIILERPGTNLLFQLADGLPAPQLSRNLVISEEDPQLGGDNLWMESRAVLGMGDYPVLPPVPAD